MSQASARSAINNKQDAASLIGAKRWKRFSKARLAVIAYHLASLLNEAGSCDDHESTLARIDEEDRTWFAAEEMARELWSEV